MNWAPKHWGYYGYLILEHKEIDHGHGLMLISSRNVGRITTLAAEGPQQTTMLLGE